MADAILIVSSLVVLVVAIAVLATLPSDFDSTVNRWADDIKAERADRERQRVR